jgi:hypothetical protein
MGAERLLRWARLAWWLARTSVETPMVSQPKSWKDTMKKGKKSAPKITIHQPAPPRMTEQQIQLEIVAKRAMRKLVDAARCPVCSAQVDGLIAAKAAYMHCVANQSHFKCEFAIGSQKPITQEITLLSERDGYLIECQLREDENYDCVASLLDASYSENPTYQRRVAKQIATFVVDIDPSWCASYEVFGRKFELLQLFS